MAAAAGTGRALPAVDPTWALAVVAGCRCRGAVTAPRTTDPRRVTAGVGVRGGLCLRVSDETATAWGVVRRFSSLMALGRSTPSESTRNPMPMRSIAMPMTMTKVAVLSAK